MRTPLRLISLIALVLTPHIVGCNSTSPVVHNRSPAMQSLSVFPTDIGITDSVVVTCIATDADGDTLVYDWATDLRLRINGNPPTLPIKPNTHNNAEVFYPNYSPSNLDTVFVACTARDRRGGSATGVITFTVHP